MIRKPSIRDGGPLFIIILVITTIAFAIAFYAAGQTTGTGDGTGTLSGNVSIGPLCPVEPCSIPHERLVAAYAARPITISTPDGTVVTTVTADPESGYTVDLEPGMYVVTIQKQGIGGSRELPATVTIKSGETVQLDISIDTGIR